MPDLQHRCLLTGILGFWPDRVVENDIREYDRDGAVCATEGAYRGFLKAYNLRV
jgi:cobalamin biosynthesis protein CbiG